MAVLVSIVRLGERGVTANMNYLRIIHGRVIDPSQGIDRVDAFGSEGDKSTASARPNLIAQKTIDGDRMIVCPALSICTSICGTGLRRR